MTFHKLGSDQVAAEVARDLLGLPPKAAIAVDVSQDEYDAWLKYKVAAVNQDDETSVLEILRERLGEEAATAVLVTCAKLKPRLGESGVPRPPDGNDSKVFSDLVSAKPRMSVQEIVRYSAARAAQLGFDPTVIWSKRQGAKSAAVEAEKSARSLIVWELRERNAYLKDVGRVFGDRSVAAVHKLAAKAAGSDGPRWQKATPEEIERYQAFFDNEGRNSDG